MDQATEYYRQFLSGDENALAPLIREYGDGLILHMLKNHGAPAPWLLAIIQILFQELRGWLRNRCYTDTRASDPRTLSQSRP